MVGDVDREAECALSGALHFGDRGVQPGPSPRQYRDVVTPVRKHSHDGTPDSGRASGNHCYSSVHADLL